MAENENPETPETPETPVVDDIKELFAFTANIDGEERILTGLTDRGITMFVCAEKKSMYDMMVKASQETANVTGKTVSIVLFERHGVMESFEPKLIEVPKIVTP